MRKTAALIAVATSLLVLRPGTARAQFVDGRCVNAGLTMGVRFGGGESSTFIGAEVSTVSVDSWNWRGLYGDVLYDFGKRAVRLSMGPEIGRAIIGADGGLVLQFGPGGPAAGFALRPVVTAGLVGAFARWEHLFGDGGTDLGETGLLLKFPIAHARDFHIGH